MGIPDRKTVRSDLVALLKENAGSLHLSDVFEMLASKWELSESEKKIQRSGEPEYQNEIRWARQELKIAGTIVPPKESGRGTWKLSDTVMAKSSEDSSIGKSKTSKEDERTIASIKSRRGQATFRENLLLAFDRKCCVTGSSIVAVLEAAHILPHSLETDYSVTNGLLLRSDIHTLFDLDLLQISESGVVRITSELLGSEYEKYNGCKVLSEIHPTMSKNLVLRLTEK